MFSIKTVDKRINLVIFIYLLILVYNIFVSYFFNINPLDIIQYFSWSGNNLGGDLLSCCKYAYSNIIVEGHPYPLFSYIVFRIINILFFIRPDDNFSLNFQFFYLMYILLCFFISFIVLKFFICKSLNMTLRHVMFLALILFCSNWSLGNVMLGNLQLATLPFCLYFCLNVDAEQLINRLISILCVCISFGLKLTPIIYSLLLLYKKKYKDFVICFFISIIIFIVPFLFFLGNKSLLENMLFFIMNSLKYSIYNIDRVGGLNTIVSFVRLLDDFFIVDINAIILISKIVSKLLLLAISICAYKRDTKFQVLAITVCISLIGPAYPHYCVLFLIPFFMYLFSFDEYDIFDYMYFILLLLIVIPYKSFFLIRIINIDESLLRSIVTDISIGFICFTILIEKFCKRKR